MSVEFGKFIFQDVRQQLEHLAFMATKKGLARKQFIMLVIDVEDPIWVDFLDDLMPNEDWQQYRDRGENPLALGTIYTEDIVDYLCEAVPDIAPGLTEDLPQGVVRAVVMAEGGASVYYIKPFPYFRDS